MTYRIEEDDLYRRRDSLRLRRFDYSSQRVYFVTIVVADRRQLFLEQRLARAVLARLLELRSQLGFKLYCYCLMPDHFHALIGVGGSGRSLGEICGAFKSLTTRDYWQWRDGRLWQRQFYDHIIRNEADFLETLEYIAMNPVRKGLVRTPDEWPYTGKVDVL
ncbi:MAG TPA: transposase [Pyrinomonadaceae bacterium]|nr:transposase [Pyrinomonadaceae bacterium]